MEGWGSKAGLGRPGEPSEVATNFVFLASVDASLYCKFMLLSEGNDLSLEMIPFMRHGS
jgi:NAD(P)-dependent dehydrogenase (short-subunit alcohol dehydrogenase family)